MDFVDKLEETGQIVQNQNGDYELSEQGEKWDSGVKGLIKFGGTFWLRA